MKKLLALAFLSLAAIGLSSLPAAAGWGCHGCCAKLNACAAQYNAFSPFCVSGVYASKHCHKCTYPAEGPCCAQPGCHPAAWCEPGCYDGWCGDGPYGPGWGHGGPWGPAGFAGGDHGALGILPPPAAAQMQGAPANAASAPGFAPPSPTPVPAIPGSTSYLMPNGMIQPVAYQPTPWYWNMGN